MARLVRIWLTDGKTHQAQTAIIGDPGRKFTRFVTVEFPLRLRKIPNEEVDRSITEVAGSLSKAIRQYRKIGRQYGMTKEAKQFLREARA